MEVGTVGRGPIVSSAGSVPVERGCRTSATHPNRQVGDRRGTRRRVISMAQGRSSSRPDLRGSERAMEMMSRKEAAERLGVTTDRIDEMVRLGELLAVRFSSGIKVVLDDSGSKPPAGREQDGRGATSAR